MSELENVNRSVHFCFVNVTVICISKNALTCFADPSVHYRFSFVLKYCQEVVSLTYLSFPEDLWFMWSLFMFAEGGGCSKISEIILLWVLTLQVCNNALFSFPLVNGGGWAAHSCPRRLLRISSSSAKSKNAVNRFVCHLELRTPFKIPIQFLNSWIWSEVVKSLQICHLNVRKQN